MNKKELAGQLISAVIYVVLGIVLALISLTQEIISTASQYVFGRCFAENWMVLEL